MCNKCDRCPEEIEREKYFHQIEQEEQKVRDFYVQKHCDRCVRTPILIIRYECKIGGISYPEKDEIFQMLCQEHAPRMSDGTPGYTHLTFREYVEPVTEVETLPISDLTKCKTCLKYMINEDEFQFNVIQTPVIHSNGTHLDVLYAIPVQKYEWVHCRRGFGCNQ